MSELAIVLATGAAVWLLIVFMRRVDEKMRRDLERRKRDHAAP